MGRWLPDNFSQRAFRRVLRVALVGYSKVFARKSLYGLHAVAHEFVLRGLGVNNEGFRTGGEEWFLRWLARERALGVVVDVGANQGDYSLFVRKTAPEARILAFEPNPKTFARLLGATSGQRVEAFPFALGEAAGEFTLYDYSADGTGHASLHSQVITVLHARETVETRVTVRTLDEVAVSELVGQIDLLKIDTEGNELACLKGARGLLAEKRIAAVHFEFNSMNLISGTTFKDFKEALEGYDLFRLFQDGMQPLTGYKPTEVELYAYQNIVALRR